MVKKVLYIICCISLIICSASVSFAKEATTGNIANVVVCVRLAGDDTDRFQTDTQKLMMLYDDTTDLYSLYNYDYSFKAYIKEISRGMLNVENIFPQYDGSVITPLTLSRNLSSSDDTTVLQEVISAFNDGRITLPSDKKVDYRISGIIDNLTVILQGEAGNSRDSMMWPHKSVCPVTTKINGRYNVGNYNFINTYSLFDSVTQQGTISHEFLHTVGLSDLYRNGESTGVPVGFWDIMASDSMYQQYPLSYLRHKMGWVPMNTISQSGDYTLDVVTDKTSDSVVFKIETPLSNSEFFCVEYRYKNPSLGYTDSKRFEAKIPSSGLLIYRVNNSVTYQTNIKGEDYIYVFRPEETSLSASAGDVRGAAINPAEGETTYGSADLSVPFTDDTIFYSNGQNSGIVISNVSFSSDYKKLNFHVEFPDYSELDLWDNVGSSLSSSGTNMTCGAVDDNGKLYTLSIDSSRKASVYAYNGSSWFLAVPAISGVSEAYIETFNNELYIIYINSSGYPVIAKAENGAWKTIATDKSVQYPVSPQLFKSDNKLYCGWAEDATTLVIKEVLSSSLSAVDRSLTASYFANPALAYCDGYIYAIYSDFFGSNHNTQLKRYNVSTRTWSAISIPSPVAYSNVHTAAVNNGELWFLAAGSDTVPTVISVKQSGEVIQKNVPTEISNFLYMGIDVCSNGTLCVGLFTSQNNSEVLYLKNGEWNKLGSSPCEAIQAADMFVYNSTVYVASANISGGNLVVRTKQMPENAKPRLVAKEDSNITVTDDFVVGIPLNAVDLSLYLDVTENGHLICKDISAGKEIMLYTADDVLVGVYTIVVRGDVDCDGFIDGCDSTFISAFCGGMNNLTEQQILACDADGNGEVNEADIALTSNKGISLAQS